MSDNIIDSRCKENIELLTKLGDALQDRIELIRTERECSRLRAQLAAMTARKDGWRGVALEIRRSRNDILEMEFGIGDGNYWRRSARASSIGRREARKAATP